jgi:hypothetical protein
MFSVNRLTGLLTAALALTVPAAPKPAETLKASKVSGWDRHKASNNKAKQYARRNRRRG